MLETQTSRKGGSKAKERETATSSRLILEGWEWKGIVDILSTMLNIDDIFRSATKHTIFMDRKLVEEALQELRRASTKVKTWILYTKREGCDHIITIATNDPAADTKLLCPNEHLLFCAPKSVDVNAKANVVIGIANACCKAMGLHDTMKKADHPILSDVQYLFAKRFWNRCHLHQRRSIGGKKAAWRRKGYLATYHEQPDTRDRKFHEGSKLFYEVTEECRNALGQT